VQRTYGDSRVLFQGHWGFQYYMEARGGQAIDFKQRNNLTAGDILITPVYHTNLQPIPEGMTRPLPELAFPVCPFLTTQSRVVGAGFYADVLGPLPFAVGRVPPEEYHVGQVNPLP